MARHPNTSAQTAMVLAALGKSPELWRHGVSLTKETGVGAGTLYPLLSRLHEQGYLEARWEPSKYKGRPPRHTYRLTNKGLSLANERQASLGRIITKPAGAT